MIRFMEACPAVQNQVIRGHPDRHQNHSGFRPESALGSAGLWASHHCKVDPGVPSRAWASRSGNPAILASRSGSIRRLGRPSLTPSARPCQTCLDLFLGSGPLQSAKTARMSSCSFPAGIVQSIRSPRETNAADQHVDGVRSPHDALTVWSSTGYLVASGKHTGHLRSR